MSSLPTRYIDSKNPEVTTEEVIALATRQAKPYPQSWYEKPRYTLALKNRVMLEEWTDEMEGYEAPATRQELLQDAPSPDDYYFVEEYKEDLEQYLDEVEAALQEDRENWEGRFACPVDPSSPCPWYPSLSYPVR